MARAICVLWIALSGCGRIGYEAVQVRAGEPEAGAARADAAADGGQVDLPPPVDAPPAEVGPDLPGPELAGEDRPPDTGRAELAPPMDLPLPDLPAADAPVPDARPPDLPADAPSADSARGDAPQDLPADGPRPLMGIVSIDFGQAAGAPWVYNGSARSMAGSVRLTADTQAAGSAFLRQPFGLRDGTNLSVHFSFRVHGGDGTNGGDGLVLVWQNAAAGSAALGLRGGNLGYAPIRPSVAVELDSFHNVGDEPNGNHLAIDVNGDHINFRQIAPNPPFDINDGITHHIWVDYNGATNTLEVFASGDAIRPAQPLLTDTIDLPAMLGDQAYVGFTSSTGFYRNVHDIETFAYDFRY